MGVVTDLGILCCLGSPQGRYCQARLGRLVRPAAPIVGASWSGERPVWAMIGRWDWGVAARACAVRTTAVWCTGQNRASSHHNREREPAMPGPATVPLAA